ncbi:MAG: hypothetical protein AABZ69_02190, partial [Candidatus Binatota bacterium]
IASILRDAFGGERRSGTGRPQPPLTAAGRLSSPRHASAAAEGALREGASPSKSRRSDLDMIGTMA